MLGNALSALVALSLVAIGAGAFIAPRASAGQYGLPVDDAIGASYVRALGSRDLLLGLIIGSSLARGAPRRTLGTTISLCALTGMADFILVMTTPGALRKRLPVHAVGILGLVALGALLRRRS